MQLKQVQQNYQPWDICISPLYTTDRGAFNTSPPGIYVFYLIPFYCLNWIESNWMVFNKIKPIKSNWTFRRRKCAVGTMRQKCLPHTFSDFPVASKWLFQVPHILTQCPLDWNVSAWTTKKVINRKGYGCASTRDPCKFVPISRVTLSNVRPKRVQIPGYMHLLFISI